MPTPAVAELVHAAYARLPKTGKPQPGEWTVLAGIVLTRPGAAPTVVAMGTGTKCLTEAQVAADVAGECVHDGHAEVCARRALVAYLLSELKMAVTTESDIVEYSPSSSGFAIRAGIELHMYSSEVPCGDASIFDLPFGAVSSEAATRTATSLVTSNEPDAKRQRASINNGEESEPEQGCSSRPVEHGPSQSVQHRTGAKPARPSAMEAEASVGGAVCKVGLVRTKPGRGPRTCCMSCSDKLARWAAIGLQGALTSLLIVEPLRLSSLTIGSVCSVEALRRAISRAVGPLPQGDLSGLGSEHASASPFAPVLVPELGTTSVPFEHGPQQGMHATAEGVAHPCSNSIIWAACGLAEAVNGLSGKRLGANRKAPSPKHRSRVCKALLFQEFRDLMALVPRSRWPQALLDEAPEGGKLWTASYVELKALASWYQERKRCLFLPGAPLADWIKAPSSCEAFGEGASPSGSGRPSQGAGEGGAGEMPGQKDDT
jgi:tRNA-specific adenosine deaminase 1